MAKVYLLPGLGADERMYASQLKHLSLDAEVINWPVPRKGMTLQAYALQVSTSIDTNRPFSLVGTSLGGIIAVELSKIIHPEKIILISSVKSRTELPLHIRSLKYLPVHRLIKGHQFKLLNHHLANILTAKRKSQFARLIKQMSDDSNSFFIEWAINEVIRWSNTVYREDIIHIHGSKDILFPAYNIKDAQIIKGGSHVMVLTHSEIISDLLEKHLSS